MDRDDDEEILEELLARYVVLRDRGTGDALARLCSEHPGQAAELTRRIESLERVRHGLSNLRSDVPRRWGRFTLIRELGRGGMGVVHLARDESLGRLVALKALASPWITGARRLERFEREVRAIAQLKHPGIVPLYDAGDLDGVPYFAMEYVEGRTLADYVRWMKESDTAPAQVSMDHWSRAAAVFRREDERSLSRSDLKGGDASTSTETHRVRVAPAKSHVERVCRIMIDIAGALDHAHRSGVVHRDVKPSNILVRADGRALLFDFGLARFDEHASLTMSGELLGTPYYVSPEQLSEGKTPVDERTDVYSLGVTLYELLALRVPFRGETTQQIFRRILAREPTPVRRLNPSVPRDLEKICLTAMEKDPERRYRSAEDLASDLRRFLEYRPVHARPVGSVTRFVRLIRRNRAASAAVALAVLVVVGGPLVFGFQNKIGRDRIAREQIRTEAQRLRAVRRLRQAQDAVDRFLTQVADRQLAGVPGMEAVRRELLEDTLAFYEELAREEGDDLQVRLGVARALVHVGEIRSHLGHFDEALRAFERLRGTVASIEGNEDVSNEVRLLLVRADLAQTHVLQGLGRVGESEKMLRDALALAEAAAASSPEDMEIRFPLSIIWRRLGTVLAMLGRDGEAEDALRNAEHFQKALFEAFPERTEFLHERAEVLVERGNLRAENGSEEDGEADFRSALEMFEELAAGFPQERYYGASSADCRLLLGALLGRRGRLREADEQLHEARKTLEDLVKSFPLTPGYRSALGRCLFLLGRTREGEGDLDTAEKLLVEAARLHEELVHGSSFEPRYLDALVLDQEALASLLARQGRLDEAEAMLDHVAETFRTLAPPEHREPGDLTLIRLQRIRGEILEARGRIGEAIGAYLDVVSRWEGVTANGPPRADWLSRFAGDLHNLALLERENGKTEESLRHAREAATRQESALEIEPALPDARRFLRNHYHLLTELYVERNRLEEAACAVDRLPDLADEPWQLVYAASVHAKCASGSAGREGREAGEGEDVRNRHIASALAWLKRAYERGSLEASDLDGPEFAILEDRPEFRALRRALRSEDEN